MRWIDSFNHPTPRKSRELVVEVATHVPDGVVCFFTSYSYMERVVQEWERAGAYLLISFSLCLYIQYKRTTPHHPHP
jgi:DNA excision repair protein ERCC-2